MSRNVCLIGMMGAGKTTVATLLGDRLGRRVGDTDGEVRSWTQTSIPDLFLEHGEEGFRELERHVIEELATFHDLVLSLGGGAVLRDDNVTSLMLTGVIVHLDVPVDVLVSRLSDDDVADRPLLGGPGGTKQQLLERLETTAEARAPRYREVADVTIDASGPPEEVVEEIVRWALAQKDVLTPSEHEQVMT
jgi:shikimate kinase